MWYLGTLTPTHFAAWGLPPIAWMLRPRSVDRMKKINAPATITLT